MAHQPVVLVTGGTGFLGAHLVPLLLSKDYQVIVVKRSGGNLGRLSFQKHNQLSFVEYPRDIKECFEKTPPDFVIHLATCYGRAHDRFADVPFTNLVIPLDVLELSLNHSVKAFLNADTFFVGTLGLPPKEKSYITTKKLFLETAREMIKNAGLKFVNLRIEQMYGPGDGASKFVPSVLKALLSNQSSLDLTPGEQRRDFIYVEDVARAFVLAMESYESLATFEEFQIGSGESLSIKDVVILMKEITYSTTDLKWGALPYRKHEIMDSKAATALNQKINWKPSYSFNDGLAATIKDITTLYGGTAV